MFVWVIAARCCLFCIVAGILVDRLLLSVYVVLDLVSIRICMLVCCLDLW